MFGVSFKGPKGDVVNSLQKMEERDRAAAGCRDENTGPAGQG